MPRFRLFFFFSRFSWFILGALLAACAANQNTDTSPDAGSTSDAMTFADTSAPPPDSTTPPEQDSTVSSADSGVDTSIDFGDTNIDFGDTNVDFGDTALVPFDAGPPPPGVAVVAGNNLQVWGVTDDGYAIYSNATTLYAVRLPAQASGSDAGTAGDAAMPEAGTDAASDSGPADGGAAAPILLEPIDATALVFVQHDVVFVWTTFSLFTGSASLSIWTSAGGLHAVSTASVPGNVSSSPFGTTLTLTAGVPNVSFAASPDSAYVLFLDNAMPMNGGTGDVYEAATSSGTKMPLVPGIDASYAFPSLGFAGGPASQTFAIVSSFRSIDTTYSIHTFSVPSWAPAQGVPSVANWMWSSNNAGTELLAFRPVVDAGTGGAEVVPLALDAGSPATIDPAGTFGVLTSDGNDVIYSTVAGGLMRSPVVSPSPTALITPPVSPVFGIYGLSPSQQSVLFYENASGNGADTDLYVASAVTNGPVTTLSSAQTASLAFPGDSFTADSSHVIFFTDFNPPLFSGPGTGTFAAALTVGGDGGVPTTLGQNVIMGWATSGAKILFNDNYSTGTTDIESVDLAGGAAPTPLVHQASTYFFLTKSKGFVVYTTAASSAPGLYVTPAP